MSEPQPLRQISLSMKESNGKETTQFQAEYPDGSSVTRTVHIDPDGQRTLRFVQVLPNGDRVTETSSKDLQGRESKSRSLLEADGTFSEELTSTQQDGSQTVRKRSVLRNQEEFLVHKIIRGAAVEGYEQKIWKTADGIRVIETKHFQEPGGTVSRTIKHYAPSGEELIDSEQAR